jgi:hypothetical protein
MNKIEKLSNGALAFITRNGAKMAVFPQMSLNDEELTTLVVARGEVSYSIRELTLHTVKAPEPAKEEPAPVSSVPAPTPKAKKIIIPESNKVLS